MFAEENRAVVRREVEELYNHTGNLDAADEIYAPNYIGHDPTFGDLHGPEAVKQSAAMYRQAFPDLEATIEDQVAEGDKVVTRFRTRGTHQGETEAFGPPHRQPVRGNRHHYRAVLRRGQDSGRLDQLRRFGPHAAAWACSRTAAVVGRQLDIYWAEA